MSGNQLQKETTPARERQAGVSQRCKPRFCMPVFVVNWKGSIDSDPPVLSFSIVLTVANFATVSKILA